MSYAPLLSQRRIFYFLLSILWAGGEIMKENEKKPPIPWELKDPKPPVIRSGHMENRIQHKDGQ